MLPLVAVQGGFPAPADCLGLVEVLMQISLLGQPVTSKCCLTLFLMQVLQKILSAVFFCMDAIEYFIVLWIFLANSIFSISLKRQA